MSKDKKYSALLFLLLLLITLLLLFALTAVSVAAGAAAVRRGGLLIFRAAAFHNRLLKLVRCRRKLVLRHVGVLHGLAELREQRAHILLLGIAHVLPLCQLALRRVRLRLGIVAHLHQLALQAVRLRVRLGVTDHLFNLFLAQAATRRDGDVLRLPGRLVLRRHVTDAVGVNVKRHLDLRHAARRRRDAHQVELAHHLVVGRHLTLTLEYLDAHLRLVVRRGREGLALLGRDRRVLRDHAREDTAQRLDAKRQRRHVQEHETLHVAAEHTAERCRAERNGLVGVHATERITPKELLHRLDHLRHPRHATNKHNLGDLLQVHRRVLDALLARAQGTLHKLLRQRLELAAAHRHLHVLGAVLVRRDEREVHLRLHRRRQLTLRLLRGLSDALQRHSLVAQVDPGRLLELRQNVVGEAQIKVLAAKVRVAVRCLHLEHAASDLEHGNIERAATQIVHGDHAVLRLVQSVRECRSRRLVHHADHVQPGDRPGVLRRLALRVVEVRRARHHRVRHLAAKKVLRRLLHLLQHERTHLRRRVLLAIGILHPRVAVAAAHDLVRHVLDVVLDVRVLEAAANQSLHSKEGGLRVCDGLALCCEADELLLALEGNNGWRGAEALSVFQHARLVALHHSDAAVRRAQVNANDVAGHLRRLPASQ
ncbi:putative heat-shock protein hsp70 [Trypanosoma cruzi]|uniref:Putative heat-shock protein hsp70 n=1 Tax=Trypanosoma cruzi TaxID=5693 RepID=A0A2V2XAB8_TRYCR|nr:putative heat-shock protein hsp70 [Trypanosoma cruzi]